ncbi:MAG: tetratricopeptide repeat protein [Acidobacteriota bacterium]
MLSNLGNVEQERQNYDAARGYYEQACRLAKEIGDQNSLTTNAFNLAFLLSLMGRADEAEPYLAIAKSRYGEGWDVMLIEARLAWVRGDAHRARALAAQARKLAGDEWMPAYEGEIFGPIAGQQASRDK